MVWVIALYNVFNFQQAVLPDTYADYNTCKLALIEKGLADIHPFSMHGKCIHVVKQK